MKIRIGIFILIACYTATFLRVLINNNFIVSISGSLLFGFFIPKRLSYAGDRVIFSGFFSCFTSFSEFIYILYRIFNQGDWIKFIIFFNLIIMMNLFSMYLGFWISRKIN